MFALLSRYWWVLIVRGLFAILFGVLAFTLPRETATALVLLFGGYAFADGIFSIAAAFAGRTMTSRWWLLLLQGLLGIGVGALTMFNPAVTAFALLFWIAGWAVAMGVLQLLEAIEVRPELTGEWWLALGGVLGVAFGILMLLRPALGALAVLGLIGTFAILWGVMLLIGAFDVHRLGKHPAV